MKKVKSIFLISLSALSLSIFLGSCGNKTSEASKSNGNLVEESPKDAAKLPALSEDDNQEFSTDYFTFTYNNAVYNIKTSEDDIAHYYQIKSEYLDNVPDNEYNTILGVIEFNNYLYEDIGSQNLETYLGNYGQSLFNSQNKKIDLSNFTIDENFAEKHTVLADGTEYYIKLLSLNPDTSIMAILRLCDYTAYFNDSLYEIYDSVVLQDFTSNYPIVSYSDIQSGDYNGQRVIVEAIADNVSIDSDNVDFALWYPNSGNYVYDSSRSLRDITPISSDSAFLGIKNGDIIRYATEIYDDGSFGTSTVLSSEITGHQNIDDVHNTFKANCPDMNYEDVSRNPDNYKNSPMKISGTIFQIISETDYSAEYLIDTPSGYVYASWYNNSDTRGSRLLENDSVTLYGKFEILKTYNTLVSENTVPQLSVIFMDLN